MINVIVCHFEQYTKHSKGHNIATIWIVDTCLVWFFSLRSLVLTQKHKTFKCLKAGDFKWNFVNSKN